MTLTQYTHHNTQQATRTSEANILNVVLFRRYRLQRPKYNWRNTGLNRPHSDSLNPGLGVVFKTVNFFNFDIMVTRNRHVDEEAFSWFFANEGECLVWWPRGWDLFRCWNPTRSWRLFTLNFFGLWRYHFKSVEEFLDCVSWWLLYEASPGGSFKELNYLNKCG